MENVIYGSKKRTSDTVKDPIVDKAWGTTATIPACPGCCRVTIIFQEIAQQPDDSRHLIGRECREPSPKISPILPPQPQTAAGQGCSTSFARLCVVNCRDSTGQFSCPRGAYTPYYRYCCVRTAFFQAPTNRKAESGDNHGTFNYSAARIELHEIRTCEQRRRCQADLTWYAPEL